MQCPNCKREVVDGARFCSNCGIQITGGDKTASDVPETGLDAYPGVEYTGQSPLTQVRSTRTIEGERRVVTILFCDVKGSTALAERLDPEEWAEIMNEAFDLLMTPVRRYGGTVARQMGDSILAFFGAPVAHEDDPQRAVLAGLEILENISGLKTRIRERLDMEFQVRVGINTGLVVVGEIGSDIRTEYTAMGDAVNVAARMEQTAPAGVVQIAEDTYHLIAPLFEVKALGSFEIKGKSRPVQAYQVLRVKDQPGSLRGIDGISTALVGRQNELDILHQAMMRLRAGRGQIVCVIGEAGIGKSRLVQEIRSELAPGYGTVHEHPVIDGEIQWRETHTVSYGSSNPYAAFQHLVRNMCGITDDDSPAEIRAKIGTKCLCDVSTPEQIVRVSRAFEVLLAVENKPEAGRLEGETFKRELFEAMYTTWQDWSQKAPLVLMFDDLHWADTASIELIIHLFGLVAGHPILILCVFRPDHQAPSWQLKTIAGKEHPEHFTEVWLAPLSRPESETLVNNLLKMADLPGELREKILEKTEGNPFFVEEVIRSLIENEIITSASAPQQWKIAKAAADIKIPDNVQTLLMARIDRLDERTRQVLQNAAIIGRTFSHRLLSTMAGMDGPLEEYLRRLETADLIRIAVRQPDLEYMFRHALTQETAYRSILHKRRRRLHKKVAETIVSMFPEKTAEYAPVIAHHYYEAGDPQAFEYYRLAGDEAFRLYANTEAVDFYNRALKTGKDSASTEDLLHLYSRRGRALELNSRHVEALMNYNEMEEIAEARADQPGRLAMLIAKATLMGPPTPVHDVVGALKFSSEALELARSLGDRASEARILWTLLLINERAGKIENAVEFGTQALSLARELNLRELLAYILNDLSQPFMAIGKFHEARTLLEEARQLYREFSNLPMLVDNLSLSIFLYYFLGRYQDALEAFSEADRISKEIGNLWGQAFSRMYIGNVYMEFGEIDRAVQVRFDCMRLAEKAGFWAPLGYTRAEIGSLYAILGAHELGQKFIDEAIEAIEFWSHGWMPWVNVTRARMYVWAGKLEEAGKELRKAERLLRDGDSASLTTPLLTEAKIELAFARGEYQQMLADLDQLMVYGEIGLLSYVPDLMYGKGMAFSRLDQLDEAYRYLLKAKEASEAVGSRRILWKIMGFLAEIQTRRGQWTEARQYHASTLALIEEFAGRAARVPLPEGVENLDLRETFLNQPLVRYFTKSRHGE